MATIESIFLSLIQNQKKVYLPDLGLFTVEHIGATIHPVSHEMTPPHSALTFSTKNSGDVNQFIDEIAKENNWTRTESLEKATQFISILKNTLSNTKSFTIGNICIVIDKGNEDFTVEVLPNIIIDKNDIGLVDIKTTRTSEMQKGVEAPIIPTITASKTETVHKETKVMEDQINPVEKTPEATPENPIQTKKSKKGIWIVLILLFIIAISVVGYLFKDNVMGLVGCNTQSKTDTVSTTKTDTVTEIAPAISEDTTTVATEETVEKVQPETETPVVEKAIVENTPKKRASIGEKADLSVIVYAPKNGNKYYVIAMSFKDLNNASKGVKQLKRKGYNPVVIDKNEQGLYRVAYKPGYETERLARDFADDLYEKQNLDPWIVKY